MINVIRMLTFDEGLRNNVYTDTKGNKTVGIGFNMDDPYARGVWIHSDIPESFILVYQGKTPLSTQSTWNILNTQVENAKSDLRSIFSDFDSYPDFVQLSLINLCFNMGKTVFSGFHTFIGLIRQSDYNTAAEDLKTTKWATELTKRAERIYALLKGDDSLYV